MSTSARSAYLIVRRLTFTRLASAAAGFSSSDQNLYAICESGIDTSGTLHYRKDITANLFVFDVCENLEKFESARRI